MAQAVNKKSKERLNMRIFRIVWIVFAIIGVLYTMRIGLRYGKSMIVSLINMQNNNNYEYITLGDERISVCGFPMGGLDRLQQDVSYSEGVDKYAECTAGGRIRFQTDSSSVHVYGRYGNILKLPWFSDYGANGIDIYIGGKWRSTLYASDEKSKSFSEVYKIENIYQETTEIEIVLPNYASIDDIMIGVERGSNVELPKPYTVQKPIVFYGSSITQGCAASRSSLSFPYLVADYFDADFVNEGFSGSALGELSVAAAIAEIDASAFVLEYDHNTKTVEELNSTHYEFYRTIREAHPETPIVLLSRISGGYSIDLEETEQRDAVIRKTYEKALAEGDENIYFIDGCDISQGNAQMLADDRHPNDYGMQEIAGAVIKCLEQAGW